MQNASAAETSQHLRFLDILNKNGKFCGQHLTELTLGKTHARATKTSLTKTLQKWCFYEFGPIQERTLTLATFATKPYVAETSQKWRVLRVWKENENFLG